MLAERVALSSLRMTASGVPGGAKKAIQTGMPEFFEPTSTVVWMSGKAVRRSFCSTPSALNSPARMRAWAENSVI
ncbi:Uncharacterised protein [Bordetella pertussis]|nr:Uncharacterised protein [Bordetella pertussis]